MLISVGRSKEASQSTTFSQLSPGRFESTFHKRAKGIYYSGSNDKSSAPECCIISHIASTYSHIHETSSNLG
jgi:hypothetical protein